MTNASLFEIDKLDIGEPTIHNTLTIFPVLGEARGPEYITLSEAFDQKLLIVTEHGDGARVPELEVTNQSEKAVLILDGEILVGAKQNRTLNTTVLLAPHSKTVVPVSCVESGRWSHTSPIFDDLDAVVPHSVRRAKSTSVAHSLRDGAGHSSDQARVWSEIEDKLGKHGVHSSSSSMTELFAEKQKEIEGYLEALPRSEGQRGLVVAIGGSVIGADILSRPVAYAEVHRRLLKGYAAEDLERRGGTPPVLEKENAREFLREIVDAELRRNPGVGLGEEFRFSGERGQGTALVHEGIALHGVFLGAEQGEDEEDPRRPEPPIYRRRRAIF